MKDIPPDIAKALKELRRLEFIALQKEREFQQAEAEAAKQSTVINEMWKKHHNRLRERLKKKGTVKNG